MEFFITLNLLHMYPNSKRAVHLAILHQISPDDPLFVVIAFSHVFRKVKPDAPQDVPISVSPGFKVLGDFKVNFAFL